MTASPSALAEANPAVDGLLEHLILERTGAAEATIGMISLPLPRELAGRVSLDHPRTGMLPVGWWKRHEIPRRAIAYVMDDAGVPGTLRFTDRASSNVRDSTAWSVEARVVKETPHYKRQQFTNIDDLRGVPPEDCIVAEFDLVLKYGERTMTLQLGATEKDGADAHHWQSVQVDRLWSNAVAQGVRVGGLIYNADTYLWTDLYLVLFANGVADVAAHFVNGKLHIQGFDFRGLPFIRFAADWMDAPAEPMLLTGDTPENDLELGGLRLNLNDCALLVSKKYPGRLEKEDGSVVWKPVARTFNPQMSEMDPLEWPPGFARTVRFQMSFSEARPLIARYRAPSWWYALSGEPWPWGYLPTWSEVAETSVLAAEYVQRSIQHGRFDGGNADFVNDGFGGTGLMRNYYHTGRPSMLKDGLDYCYYWADIAVDHTDFTVHQWIGGWPWKTCAYSKFRDVLFGYLETGDPYLLDTTEMCAASYWAWFRANWPRHSIGRDSFEVGTWALMWRYFDSQQAMERSIEFARMMHTVLETRGNIGGQMGVGPHPGHLPSLYLTGIGMTGLLEIAEAQIEHGDQVILPEMPDIPDMLRRLSSHFMRTDIEMFPSEHEKLRTLWWVQHDRQLWCAEGCRIYSELPRITGFEDEPSGAGLRRFFKGMIFHPLVWARSGRPGSPLLNPMYHDAMMLAPRWTGQGVALAPIGVPGYWPKQWRVDTPAGTLLIDVERDGKGATLRFSAERAFPVSIRYGTFRGNTNSMGELRLPPDAHPDDSGGAMNVLPFIGKGFGEAFDKAILNVGVAGVDRVQTLSEVRLCAETEKFLYETESYTPRQINYQPGKHHKRLDTLVAQFDAPAPRGRALQAMEWVRQHVRHPHLVGYVPGNRGMWCEQELIESGVGWCNEQARVFIALCHAMCIPARLCFVYHRNGQCSHAACEAFVDGRWAFFDQTFGVAVELPSGLLAEGRELSGPYRHLAHQAYEPALRTYYDAVLPYVKECPAWGNGSRPTIEQGGDLLHTLGICQYASSGVMPLGYE